MQSVARDAAVTRERRDAILPAGIASAEAVVPPVAILMSTPFWFYWAQIAIRHQSIANMHRAKAEADRSSLSESLTAETQASMVAITASAHAIDAFYGKCEADIVIPPETLQRWERRRPSRKNKLLQTFGFGFDVDTQRWQGGFDWLFGSARDRAVHHGERTRSVVLHPVETYTAPEIVDYSVESSARAVDLMLDVLDKCTSSPKKTLPGLVTKCEAIRRQVEELFSLREC